MFSCKLSKYKKLSFFALACFVFFCAIYSLGIGEKYFLKNPTKENYEMGEFKYTGKFLDGKFEGEGKIILNNGDQCSGNFRKGILDGNFIYTSENGYSIKGLFKSGKLVYGELITDDKKALISENGEVKYTNAKGWSYDGNFNEGGQNGAGVLVLTNGCKYDGNFIQGLVNKEGTYYSSDGTVIYEGNFKNGLFDGLAAYMFNSTYYKGQFVNGLPEGRGEYKSKDGWIYEGIFKSGVFDGEGIITDASGNKSTGTWKEGKRVI